jgi:hypothetical protein
MVYCNQQEHRTDFGYRIWLKTPDGRTVSLGNFFFRTKPDLDTWVKLLNWLAKKHKLGRKQIRCNGELGIHLAFKNGHVLLLEQDESLRSHDEDLFHFENHKSWNLHGRQATGGRR